MKRFMDRAALLLLLSALAVSAACSGDDSKSQARAVTEEATEEQPAARKNEEAVAEAPGAAEEEQERSAEEIFEQERRERELARQKEAILLQEHLLQAERLLEAGRVDQAEMAVFRALELDADNARAIELLQGILAIKGDPQAEAADISLYVANRRRLIREARKAQVNDLFVRANHDYEAGELARAREALEEANTIMRFDEFQTDFGTLKSEVPALLDVVRHKLEQKRKADEEAVYEEIYEKLQEKEEKERRERSEMVRRMLIEAIEAYQRGEFDESEFLARKVLRTDPGNQKAKELVYVSQQSRNAAWRETQFAQRRSAYQKWLEEIREAQIPYTGLLQWVSADDWADLTKRRAKADAAALQVQDSEAVRAIRAKLENETVNLDFGEEETTLSDAIKHIRSTQNINIVIDRDVETEKGEEPVNISVTNIKLGDALKLMLEQLELAYTFKDDVLYVTSKEKALGNPIPRVYWVRDLTISLPNFKAPDLVLRPGGAGEASKMAIWGEDLERTQDTSVDQLMDLIRENVGAGTWDNEGFSLGASAGQIVAVTTPKIHQELDRFLNDLREFTKLTVHVEARFISVDRATLDEIGVDFRGLGGANPGTVALLDDITNGPPNNASLGLDNGGVGLPGASSQSPSSGAFYNDGSDGDVRARTENIFDRMLGQLLSSGGGFSMAFTFLDDLEVTALLRAVEKSYNSTVVSAPRLTIYNNQRANLTLVNQVSYVKDYDVEVAQTAFIADPLIDVVQDGLTLDVRPTISHDRKYVTLEIKPTVANLTRPIRTFETNLSGLTTPVIIELPELQVQSAATTVRVPDNGYLVIGGFKHLSTVDRRSETPILSNIPIVSFFFSKKGRSDELRDLIILLHVQIVDLSEQERELVK